MSKSHCCKAPVSLRSANDYGAYYGCDGCGFECDIIKIISIHKDMNNAEIQPGIILQAVDV